MMVEMWCSVHFVTDCYDVASFFNVAHLSCPIRFEIDLLEQTVGDIVLVLFRHTLRTPAKICLFSVDYRDKCCMVPCNVTNVVHVDGEVTMC